MTLKARRDAASQGYQRANGKINATNQDDKSLPSGKQTNDGDLTQHITYVAQSQEIGSQQIGDDTDNDEYHNHALPAYDSKTGFLWLRHRMGLRALLIFQWFSH